MRTIMIFAALTALACGGGGKTSGDDTGDTGTGGDDTAGDDTTGDDTGTPNTAPTVTADGPAVALVGDPVVLSAEGADDEGDTLTFTWTQTGGPTVPLDTTDPTAPRLRPRRVGTYAFSVTVDDGTDTSEAATVQVAVHDLDGGRNHSVWLQPDGTLRTWGGGGDGALGSGSDADRTAPGPVCGVGEVDCAANPLTGIVAVAAGEDHVLALTDQGNVLAWGEDVYGQLGNADANADDVFTPGQVCDVGATDCAADPLGDVVAIAAGYRFSVALHADGTLTTWGTNGNGELGDATQTQRTTPIRVCTPGETDPCGVFLDGIVHVRAGGGGHTLVLDDQGRVWGWGHNKRGQTGSGVASNVQSTPEPVCAPGQTPPCTAQLTGVDELDAWSGHSLAIQADGTLLLWGSADNGELSFPGPDLCLGSSCALVPTPACATGDTPCTTPLGPVRDAAAARRYTTAVRVDGSVVGWGENFYGQLGDGTTDDRLAPVQVCDPSEAGNDPPCTSFLEATVVAAGNFHTFALTDDGTLYGWGADFQGMVGDGAPADDEVRWPTAVVP